MEASITRLTIPGIITGDVEVGPNLGPTDHRFLRAVYQDGLGKYQRRLASVGLAGLDTVLDAGCGFGQWSLALSSTCRQVSGFDLCPDRVAICQALSHSLGIGNTAFAPADLTSLPVPDLSFDGAICYSVIYFTEYRRVLTELHRVLRPGARLYLSTNAIGHYLYQIVENRNALSDYSPRLYGIRTILNSVFGKRRDFSLRAGAQVMSRPGTCAVLRDIGFDIVASGPEGTLGADPAPFLRTHYLGQPCSFDIIALKRKSG